MIWVTSDFHFGHEKDFLWQPRGFQDWKSYAEAAITNYNNLVADDDTVYILGDCVLKNNEFGIECLKQLKGHKFLAIGNHDTESRIALYKEENIFEDIQYGYRITYGKFQLWLQHYPSMMGNFKDKCPVICLAGHTHSPDRYQNMLNGCYNVSLDAHKCAPVNIVKIIEDIKDYRQKHPVCEYPDKTPYCASCRRQFICTAKRVHSLICAGYVPISGEE